MTVVPTSTLANGVGVMTLKIPVTVPEVVKSASAVGLATVLMGTGVGLRGPTVVLLSVVMETKECTVDCTVPPPALHCGRPTNEMKADSASRSTSEPAFGAIGYLKAEESGMAAPATTWQPLGPDTVEVTE